jgi:hypothetical protein
MNTMKKSGLVIGLLMLFVMSVTLVYAQDLIIFPAKGQSAEQMEKDKTECYTWAKQQTGVDPMAMAQAQASAAPATSTAPQGEAVVKGAAKGAAAGAVVGAIAGDAGKGAAIGAAAGGMSGGARNRSKANAAEDAQKQADEKMKQDIANYNRAFTACLEGKGYTVK